MRTVDAAPLSPDELARLYRYWRAANDLSVGQIDHFLGKEPVELVACHRRGNGRPPYERLIGDAAVGDRSLFAREDSMEAAWRVVKGVLDDRTPVRDYEPGSWGPPQADWLLAPGEHWHVPGSAAPAARSSPPTNGPAASPVEADVLLRLTDTR